MKKILIISLFIIFSIVSISYAQQVTVDLTKLSNNSRNEIMDLQKKTEETKIPTKENVKSWIGIGKEIGEAVNETAKALNVNVNEFAKTPVGKLTTFFLIYKIIGKDLTKLVLAICLFIFIMIILLWSFRKFHLQEKIIEYCEDKKTIKQIRFFSRYDWNSDEAKLCSAFAHGILFLVSVIALIIVICNI